jgi:hypothetical protein
VEKGLAEGQSNRDALAYKLRFMRALAELTRERETAMR